MLDANAVTEFSIDKKAKSLRVDLFSGQSLNLSFEYLRVCSPAEAQAKNSQLVAHKKLVMLAIIESVGKHGYRFVFDDGHHAIYPADYLLNLAESYETRWTEYLQQIEQSPLSREPSINFKEV